MISLDEGQSLFRKNPFVVPYCLMFQADVSRAKVTVYVIITTIYSCKFMKGIQNSPIKTTQIHPCKVVTPSLVSVWINQASLSLQLTGPFFIQNKGSWQCLSLKQIL